MLDNEIEMEVWRQEFEDYEDELTKIAAKNVCRISENSNNVSIATIKSEYNRLKNERENIDKLCSSPKVEKASPDFISKLIKEHFA